MSENNPNNLSITLTLDEYVMLETRNKHYQYSNISLSRAQRILALNGHELICHVQMPGEAELASNSSVARLWIKRDWDTDYENWKERQVIAKRERYKANIRTENLDSVIRAVLKKFPHFTVDMGRDIAKQIVSDPESAKLFGVTLESDELPPTE